MKKSMFNNNETALFDSVGNRCEKIEDDLMAAYAAYLRNMKDLRMWKYTDDLDEVNKVLDEHKHALASVRFSINECNRRAKDAEEIYSKVIGINSIDYAMFGVYITENAQNIVKRRIFATIAKINTISSLLMLKEHEIKNEISDIVARIDELTSRKK